MLPLVLKTLHIFTAFWLIAGLLGRYVAQSRAATADDIDAVRAIMPVAGVFEKAMVIPGSFAVLVAGLLTAWTGSWPVLGFMQGGSANWVLISLILFLTLMPLIRFVFVPRGRAFEVALDEAINQGRVTPALSAAFRDPIVRAAHYFELGVITLIVVLMVLKPF